MHRLTFALALALALPSLAPAQQPFAAIGSTWTYTQGSCCGPDTNVAVIIVAGDTSIDGHAYHHLIASSGWFICYTIAPFIRNVNDSMFYREAGGTEEHLLFRWNAVPGDTWSTPIGPDGVDTLDWTVADTGHVDVDGITLRTLTVNQFSRQFALIAPTNGLVSERLGLSTAPFCWTSGVCDGESFIDLRCFTDGQMDMLNPQYPQCSLVTGIVEAPEPDSFTVFPASVESGGLVHVQVGADAVGHSMLEVRDVAGRTIRSVQVTGEDMAITMNRAGVMLVTYTPNNGHRITRRVLVR